MPQARGTKGIASDKSYVPSVPLPVDHWYRDRLRQALDRFVEERKIRRPGIRELTAELAKIGTVVSEDRVGRYLKQAAFAIDLIGPVSAVLDIPPPAVIAATEKQARLIAAVPSENATDGDMIDYYLAGLVSIRKRIDTIDQTSEVGLPDGELRQVGRR